jgi:hypothetical protein
MEGDRPDARLDTTAADDEQARYAHQATLLLCSWHPHLADDNGFPRLRGNQGAARPLSPECERPGEGPRRDCSGLP